jgi:amino acid transporter
MTSNQELFRDLEFLEAYTIGRDTMIGAGIFILPSIAAANAGPASMISFAIGGFVSLLAALSLSELATSMPRARGSYFYVNRAMGSFFGSIVGWGMWSGLTFATAFYIMGFAQYLTYFYGNSPVGVTALVMAVLLILLNFRGTKKSAIFQNMIVLLLVVFILIFILLCIFGVDLEILKPFNPKR